MASPLQIAARAGARAGQRVLRVEGRLGMDSVPEFLKAIRAEKEAAIILEMGGVPSIDSAGVGALVQTFTAFQKSGRKLALVQVGEGVASVLEVTKVLSLFPRFASVAEAEQQLG